jgi:hypothetical protein
MATDGIPASENFRAMYRAWSMLTQNPSARIAVTSAERRRTWLMTRPAHASFPVRRFDKPATS